MVVCGTARVTIGDKVQMLHENELVYVPSGAPHRLENPGKIDLELSVQTGSYLGEDDSERIEDDYTARDKWRCIAVGVVTRPPLTIS